MDRAQPLNPAPAAARNGETWNLSASFAGSAFCSFCCLYLQLLSMALICRLRFASPFWFFVLALLSLIFCRLCISAPFVGSGFAPLCWLCFLLSSLLLLFALFSASAFSSLFCFCFLLSFMLLLFALCSASAVCSLFCFCFLLSVLLLHLCKQTPDPKPQNPNPISI